MADSIQRIPSDLPLPFSRAVRAGGFLFLSGQLPLTPQGDLVRGDIRTQTEAVLERIGETLAAAGASFAQVVRATVWLTDMNHFNGFNEVYQRYFEGGFPARSTVASGLAFGADIEIEVQAWVGE